MKLKSPSSGKVEPQPTQSEDLRGDVERFAAAHTDEMGWQPSPSPTVWRKRVERIGPAEAGRVTALVRYDAGSRFHSHPHPGGEEIFVLQGTFSDEHGDYEAGTHLLNPEGFEHAPFSRDGCVIFVKLRQYAGADRPQQNVQRRESSWRPGHVEGVETLPLYSQPGYPETIRLERYMPRAALPERSAPGGREVFVISGSYTDEHGAYREGSWARYPAAVSHTAKTSEGCVLYVKEGHLA